MKQRCLILRSRVKVLYIFVLYSLLVKINITLLLPYSRRRIGCQDVTQVLKHPLQGRQVEFFFTRRSGFIVVPRIAFSIYGFNLPYIEQVGDFIVILLQGSLKFNVVNSRALMLLAFLKADILDAYNDLLLGKLDLIYMPVKSLYAYQATLLSSQGHLCTFNPLLVRDSDKRSVALSPYMLNAV